MSTLKYVKQKMADDANKKKTKPPPKPHPYTQSQLASKKVTELREIVRGFNLHYAIKGYSTMKKKDLIENLASHGKKVNKTQSKPVEKPNKKQFKPVEKPMKLIVKPTVATSEPQSSLKRKVDRSLAARRKAKTSVTQSFPKMQVIKEKRNE